MRVVPLLFVSLALFGCSAAVEDEEAETSADAVSACSTVSTSEVDLATAGADGEAILTIAARATSKTSWAEAGNEAVVLEVRKNGARLGHVVMHQGQDRFAYEMHAGALKKGDRITAKVSPLTAKNAAKSACLETVTLTGAPANMAEGLANAPIYAWPVQKVFNDLPVMSGWSRRGKSYQGVYTNEDGGTVELCGGGAKGMRSEIARWGRGVDIEGVYRYESEPLFERCGHTKAKPRLEGTHPVVYYGNGHNNLFESRGGYGQDCGRGSDNTPNGDLPGWNKDNPGNEASKDEPFTILLRPVPVDLDAGGSREDLVNAYAPWLYRVLDGELKREKRVDGEKTFSMERYLYVDVHASDVGGSGDETCGPLSVLPGLSRVDGGFRLRAIARDGTVSDGPQMTKSFFGGDGNGVKRIAIPLKPGIGASDITAFEFDAYDDDGIYFVGLGDAFVPRAAGTNGATLDYVPGLSRELRRVDVYVDDDRGGCVDGHNTKDGRAYPCAGSAYTLRL